MAASLAGTSASNGATPRAGLAATLVSESFFGMATSTGYATNSGVNCPRQSRKAGVLRVLCRTSSFWLFAQELDKR